MINVWGNPWTGKHMLCGRVSLLEADGGVPTPEMIVGSAKITAHCNIDSPGVGLVRRGVGRWLLSLPPHPQGAYLWIETCPTTRINSVAKWVARLPESDAYRVGFDKYTLNALSISKAEPFDTAFGFMLLWED